MTALAAPCHPRIPTPPTASPARRGQSPDLPTQTPGAISPAAIAAAAKGAEAPARRGHKTNDSHAWTLGVIASVLLHAAALAAVVEWHGQAPGPEDLAIPVTMAMLPVGEPAVAPAATPPAAAPIAGDTAPGVAPSPTPVPPAAPATMAEPSPTAPQPIPPDAKPTPPAVKPAVKPVTKAIVKPARSHATTASPHPESMGERTSVARDLPDPPAPGPAHSDAAPASPTAAAPAGDGAGAGRATGAAAGDGPAGVGAGVGVGGGDGEAAPMAGNPKPSYPIAARRAGKEGVVLVHATIGADGTCTEVSLARSSGVPSLDQAALDVLRQWRFTPARRGGQPVASEVNQSIAFHLDGNG